MRYDLIDIIEVLSLSNRSGSDVDEPEGSRFIQLSDTLVRDMVVSLERMNASVDWSADSPRQNS